MMLFEFETGPEFDFLTSFGQKYAIPVNDHLLMIPASMGSGMMKKLDLGVGKAVFIV